MRKRCTRKLREARTVMPRPSRCLGAHDDCPVCLRTLVPLFVAARRVRAGRTLRFGADAPANGPRARRATVRSPRRVR